MRVGELLKVAGLEDGGGVIYKGLLDPRAHTHLSSRPLVLVFHTTLLPPPQGGGLLSVCLCRGTEVCLINTACLEGDTMDVSCLVFPVAFAGGGDHVNNLGKGAG